LFSKKGGTGKKGGQEKVERKKKRTLQLPQRLPTRQLVAFSDLLRVQAHYEEVFCFFEELAGKDYDCCRTVADLDVMGD
jgi:hypothetical protein